MTDATDSSYVYYRAVSILRSRTAWLNAASFAVAILSATEVVTIIPAKYAQTTAAIIAVLNIYLRTQTVRPVALIGPNATESVAVKKVGPPTPAGMTD